MLTRKERLNKVVKKIRIGASGVAGHAKPVFIFGAQRSGTNMLIRTLNKSSDIECYNENDDEAFDRYILRNPSVIERLVAKSFAKRVVFKCISDSQKARVLLDGFEGARAVWIYRRPNDVVNSMLRNWPQRVEYIKLILFNPEKAGWRAENLSSDDLLLIGRLYKKRLNDSSARALVWYLRNKLFLDQGLHEDDRVTLIKYEDLVVDPVCRLAVLFRTLGCSFDKEPGSGVFATSIGKSDPPDVDDEVRVLCENLVSELDRYARIHS